MNLFKKIFGANKNTNTYQSPNNQNRGIEIKTSTTFVGLDDEFIELIYFPSEEKRDSFKQQLIEILKELGITNESQRTEVMEKFPNYVTENNINLPFIAELFIFESYIIKVSKPEETIIETTKGSPGYRGKEKLKHYYTAVGLASHNIYGKNENGIIDISDEENLVIKTLSDQNKDFACANILLLLGNSFMMHNNIDKMVFYYEKLFSSDFDLSPTTIANFIRAAGEDFYKIGDTEKALKYLKKGLELNPKLGVKKLVTEIEKKTNQ